VALYTGDNVNEIESLAPKQCLRVTVNGGDTKGGRKNLCFGTGPIVHGYALDILQLPPGAELKM
jgi:hypothetical protein